MHLFVTGATGFLGGAVVACARQRGHRVTALARHGRDDEPGIHWVRGDVRDPTTWSDGLAGADVVVHLAATVGGDPDEQRSVAVDGTRAVVRAMADAGVPRLVLVSSLAVYDLSAPAPGGVVDESTPVEEQPRRRDPYARAKLDQELAARAAPWCTVLRPGLVWDRDHHWNGGWAASLGGRLGVTIAPDGRLPLTHVVNCAAAVVAAAEHTGDPVIVNVVDDSCPTRAEFRAALRDAGIDLGPEVRVPWVVADAVARAASRLAGPVGVRDRLPGLLRPAQLSARCRPLRYDNTRARVALSWEPSITLEDGLRPPQP